MALAEALAAYVPVSIARRLRRASAQGRLLRLDAVLLFADISGSTALAERLAERGDAGAEELGRVFSEQLGSVIDSVTAHGGEVIKFAGDGLFALWSAEESSDLAAAARLAARCALEVQRARSAGDSGLSLRLGIGAGPVDLMALGDADVHLELAALGEAVIEACRAEELARPGEVVLGRAAANLLGDGARGTPLAAGGLQLESMSPSSAPVAAAARAAAARAASPQLEPGLRIFAPAEIESRLGAGHGGWLAELRRVSVLFVRLPHDSVRSFDAAQRAVVAAQRVLARHRGTLARVGTDVQGLALKVVFGLPPHATENNARRALEAAMEVAELLGEAYGGAGIATGRAFCGDVGSTERREYTTVGGVVHLAARLMQSAAGALLCDAATASSCGGEMRFETLTPISVKGVAEAVSVFRPVAKASPRTAGAFVVGREAERARLAALVERLGAEDGVGPIVIEGEGGIGKSTLAREFRRLAESRGARVLLGRTMLMEESTPYFAFRRVLEDLFGIDESGSGEPALEERRALVRDRLARSFASGDDRSELLPLLEAVLPLGQAENQRTRQMHGQARADNLHLLLVDLLDRAARAAPLVLLIEDAHWMDSASWAVAELVAQRVPSLLLALFMRPLAESAVGERRRLLREAEIMRLGPLPREAAEALLRHRFGVSDVAAPVAEWIGERAAGHPFYIEELAQALLERGMVLNAGDECRLAPAAGDLRACDIPATLDGVITSRIDRLPPRQQLALKVASAIGPSFSHAALCAAYPLEDERPHLAGDLEDLVAADLLVRGSNASAALAYAFKHAVTQQVAYALLPYAQRRRIHAAVAQWVEREYAGQPERAAALLAYHWGEAARGDAALAPRAIDLLERAGERAVATFANREAVRFLGHALELADALGEASPVRPLRRARWQRQMGEAYYGLGELPRARGCLEAALALLGHPLPASRRRMAASLLFEIGRQTGRRLMPRMMRTPADQEERQVLLEAASACAFLNVLLVVNMELFTSVYASLLMLNLAEPAGPSRPLAYGYGSLGLILGTLNHRLASGYLERALRCGDSLPDRSTHLANFFALGWFHARSGRWRESLDGFTSARAVAAEIGDWRFWELSTMLAGSIDFARGRFAESLEVYGQARDSAQRRGDVDAQALAIVGCVTSLAMLGRAREALETLESLQSWLGRGLETLVDRGIRINGLGMKALVLFQLGDAEGALAAAAAVAELAAGAPPTSHYGLPGYAAAAEVRLRLAEAARDGGEAAARSSLARASCRNLKSFARLYPFARAQYLLCDGLRCWLDHKPRAARRAWHGALELARRLDLLHEQGLAHLEIGRHATDAGERRTHLERARDLLRQAGAEYGVRSAEEELRRDHQEDAP